VVNGASRIEQLNKQFGSQLLISETVWQAVSDKFDDATVYRRSAGQRTRSADPTVAGRLITMRRLEVIALHALSRFLGTGLGSALIVAALIVEGVLEPMSFPYKTRSSFESENHLFESSFTIREW